MKYGEGSRTAERVAMLRAVHQLLDAPLVFEDPLALDVVAPSLVDELRRDPRRFGGSWLGRYLRAFLAVRSRFAEDRLRLAVARGVRQYVVLGAGFDTFAYRNPFAADGLIVFEIDHLATQQVKRRRLRIANIEENSSVRFVAVDFESADLAAALRESGFDDSAPAFVSWLGVVPYLDLPSIRATLQIVGSWRGEATLVFDYGVPPASLGWLARFFYRRVAARLAQIGEPWKTFFTPEQLRTEVSAAGLDLVEDAGGRELERMYLAKRRDGLRVGSAGHIAVVRNRAMGSSI